MTIHYAKLSPKRPNWLGGGQWILNGLNDVTVLFGKNGSGKSLLLRALFDELKGESQYISPERAGDVSYQVGIVQEELQSNTRGGQRRGKNHYARFRQESVSRLGSLKMKIGDVAGRGQSVKAVLTKVENSLSTLLPDFKFSIIDEPPLFKLEKHYIEKNELVQMNVQQLSSGETEMLTIATELLTVCNLWILEKQKQRVLLIDEPDPHLHPDLQISLAEFIIKLGQEYETQIILATHSTTLLASLGQYGRNKVGLVYLNNSKSEQKVILFNEYFQRLTVCLGGHALMGPLFDAPLLLVEGDDDYQIWSHLPRNPNYRKALAVIPSDGDQIKKYQQTLEQLFSSIREQKNGPIGYALIDGDKSFPTNCDQDHIQYIRLNCRESENIYLSDEVLNKLGYTWPEASELIVEKADEYGSVSENLKKCTEWDRAQIDLKGLIIPISQILDKKGLYWTMRLGKLLGDRKPKGQLAEFIGDDALEVIWG